MRNVVGSRLIIAFICAVTAIVVSGCFPTYSWYKEGASQQNLAADKAYCDMASARAYPRADQQVITQQGYRTQGQSTCNVVGGHLVCHDTPGQYVAPQGYTVDRNAEARDNAYNNCMMGKGWVLRRDSDVAQSSSRALSLGAGAACTRSQECVGDLGCISGRCMQQSISPAMNTSINRPEGSGCNVHQECSGALKCISGQCVNLQGASTYKKEGAACSAHQECAGMLQCDAGVCRNVRTGAQERGLQVGATCVSSFQCEGDLVCLSGRCSSRDNSSSSNLPSNRPEGSTCDTHQQCSGALKCISRQCRALNAESGSLKSGDVCRSSMECAGTMRCITGRCTEQSRKGS